MDKISETCQKKKKERLLLEEGISASRCIRDELALPTVGFNCQACNDGNQWRNHSKGVMKL